MFHVFANNCCWLLSILCVMLNIPNLLSRCGNSFKISSTLYNIYIILYVILFIYIILFYIYYYI